MSLTRLFYTWLVAIGADPWSAVFPVLGTILALALYWRGVHVQLRTGRGRPTTPLQSASFMAGLALVLLAISSPFDAYADENLSAHMAQHEILILAAPPLLLLGAPIWPLWRAFPLRWRRAALRQIVRRRWMRHIGSGFGWLIRRPIAVWALFMVVFLGWHIPFLYTFALEHEAAHALEHIMFLLAGLAFWAQVVPSFPLRPSLGFLQRAGYLFAGAIALHLVAVLFAIDVRPIYPIYGVGDAAIAAQASAGAIMDVCGQVVFTIAILVCLAYWLSDEERSEKQTTPEPVMQPSPQGILLLAETEYVDVDPVAPTTSQSE